MNNATQDSPVERRRKEGLCGTGNWPRYEHVYKKLARACETMAKNRYLRLSDEHVDAMAALGSGHEERMKAQLHHLRHRGFVKDGEVV